MDEEVEGREEGRGGKEEMPKNRLAGQVKTQHSLAQDPGHQSFPVHKRLDNFC
jgi:hypothetical protein